jgi:TonB family protein
MNGARLAALLALAAPAAGAWVPCEQKGLTAPVPIRRDAPAYPEAVRAMGIEGAVEVALTVLRDGSVGWVRVVRASPRGYFEQAASEGVRRWRFRPALLDGEPVECRMRTRVRFTLTDAAATSAGAAGGASPRPVYPPALLAGRIEGYAEVEFELDSAGKVKNPRVITAMPRGEFEQAALEALRGWRGPPSGRPARRETRRFDFRLPDSWLGEVPATLLASAPFPMAACERRTTGRVLLEVDTEATGQVRGARILSAEPPGLFDATAFAIAHGSRLSPAYRDGQPIAATALMTLFFDPDRASCPDTLQPDRRPPAGRRPPPRVTHDERPPPRAQRAAALSPDREQPVP